MKSPILLIVLFLLLSVSSVEALDHPHAYGGIPSDGAFIDRQGYIIQFDFEHKTPRWVAYHVKPSYLDKPPREGQWAKFRNDPDIRNEATELDYKGQFHAWGNYAKGYLTPYFISGGDRDSDGKSAEDGDPDDAKTIYEVMYMSNMAPQHHYNFNGSGGLWYSLETYVRENLLKKQQREVWAFAGCIYGPREYDTIGDGVEVPPMFFKIVVTETGGKPVILAFLFPHQSKKHGEIQDYLVSVNIIEAMTGLDFFPDLHDEEWEQVERTSTLENWQD